MPTDMSNPATLAKEVRRAVLGMVHRANASHVGGCFSMADILAVLYGGWLRVRPDDPAWADRDRLVVSKGHAAAAVYAVLSKVGFFPDSWLDGYCEDGQPLAGHVSSTGVPGVEVSTGSLGHGLSIGCGLAMGAQRTCPESRTVVILSDGELDEGSIWEAALFAGHHKLGQLTAIIDFNKIQSFGAVTDVLCLDPLADKWRAANWDVQEIDGHDHTAIAAALADGGRSTRAPRALIAHTVKGKGVSFMENDLAWHYKSPDTAQLAAALAELDA